MLDFSTPLQDLTVPGLDKANEHAARNAQPLRAGNESSAEWAAGLPVPPSEAVLDDFICECHCSFSNKTVVVAVRSRCLLLLSSLLVDCVLYGIMSWLFTIGRCNG